jgi:hypothetical protein
MRSFALIGLAIILVVHPSTAECQRSSPALTLARKLSHQPLTLIRTRSDSAAPTRRAVLVGALVGGVVGGLLYVRDTHNSHSDDGDFPGIAIPLYVTSGVIVGSLVGWVVSVSIENHRTHS